MKFIWFGFTKYNVNTVQFSVLIKKIQTKQAKAFERKKYEKYKKQHSKDLSFQNDLRGYPLECIFPI